jgi:hypothetical protein
MKMNFLKIILIKYSKKELIRNHCKGCPTKTLLCRRTNDALRNEKRKMVSLFDVFLRSFINGTRTHLLVERK